MEDSSGTEAAPKARLRGPTDGPTASIRMSPDELLGNFRDHLLRMTGGQVLYGNEILRRLRAAPERGDGAPQEPPNAGDPLVSRSYPWCVMDTAAGQQIWHSGGDPRICTQYEAAKQLNAYAAALAGRSRADESGNPGTARQGITETVASSRSRAAEPVTYCPTHGEPFNPFVGCCPVLGCPHWRAAPSQEGDNVD